ncbi:MAG: hypothetical protein HYR96_13135 [Deltaproteobacteria bacterium]|nr:hypothetical protein [Deltaproteobacteria bacterium]MBI3295682.1 hypothetical protein [Deltaproteobacteria bacterium]
MTSTRIRLGPILKYSSSRCALILGILTSGALAQTYRVETASLWRARAATAVQNTDRFFSGRQASPETYRQKLSDELVRLRGAKAKPSETILFLDTPVTDASGGSLNRPGVTLVIDHHGLYYPEAPLDNTVFQLLARLRQSMAQSPTATEAVLKRFRFELFGDAEVVTFITDNLGDAAETIAVARSPAIQQRLVTHPEWITLLEESGRYTDFYVFRGDLYEHSHTGEANRRAILLSKAIMQNHQRLLREAGVLYGDRLEFLSNPDAQARLLRTATDESEALLLEALSPNFSTVKPGRIGALAADFEKQRGGPHLIAEKSLSTSYAQARQSRKIFLDSLRSDLSLLLTPNLVADAEGAIIRYTYAHQPVSTHNQFADWSASGLANEFEPGGFRPIQVEISGKTPTETGRPVIISKAGDQDVDLKPLAVALNQKAAEKRRNLGRAIADERPPEFTSRGHELVFSFGGHSLTRAEITSVIGLTLSRLGAQIVPMVGN